MYNQEELRTKCRAFLEKPKETYDTLAKRVGLSRSTINVFVRGGDISSLSLGKLHNYFVTRESVNKVPEQKELKDIGFAISMLLRGKKVKRNTWQNKYLTIKEVIADADFDVKPIIFLVSSEKSGIAWLPTIYDLFATNWEVLE